MDVPASGFKIGPDHTVLLENSDELPEPEEIHGKVWVYLCDDHRDEAADMVEEGRTPVVECDGRHVSVQTKGLMAAFAGKPVDELETNNVTPRLLEDAVITYKAAKRGSDYVTEVDLFEAKVVILTHRRLQDGI